MPSLIFNLAAHGEGIHRSRKGGLTPIFYPKDIIGEIEKIEGWEVFQWRKKNYPKTGSHC